MPLFCSFFNLIKVFLHLICKLYIYDLWKTLFHKIGCNLTEFRRNKAFALTLNIFMTCNCCNCCGISWRSANAVFFKCFDEWRLRISCRRLCKVLIFLQLFTSHNHIFFKWWELCSLFFFNILAFHIECCKALKIDSVSRRLKCITVGNNISLCCFLDTISHLWCSKSVPNELI